MFNFLEQFISTKKARQVTPAAVLAYDLYDDASRGEEITRRNGLAHPGFVPPTTLKVLNA